MGTSSPVRGEILEKDPISQNSILDAVQALSFHCDVAFERHARCGPDLEMSSLRVVVQHALIRMVAWLEGCSGAKGRRMGCTAAELAFGKKPWFWD
jgi:hypothetical protein